MRPLDWAAFREALLAKDAEPPPYQPHRRTEPTVDLHLFRPAGRARRIPRGSGVEALVVLAEEKPLRRLVRRVRRGQQECRRDHLYARPREPMRRVHGGPRSGAGPVEAVMPPVPLDVRHGCRCRGSDNDGLMLSPRRPLRISVQPIPRPAFSHYDDGLCSRRPCRQVSAHRRRVSRACDISVFSSLLVVPEFISRPILVGRSPPSQRRQCASTTRRPSRPFPIPRCRSIPNALASAEVRKSPPRPSIALTLHIVSTHGSTTSGSRSTCVWTSRWTRLPPRQVPLSAFFRLLNSYVFWPQQRRTLARQALGRAPGRRAQPRLLPRRQRQR